MWEFSIEIKLLPKFFTKCWLRQSLADKSLCILLYTKINLESVLSFTHSALTFTSPEWKNATDCFVNTLFMHRFWYLAWGMQWLCRIDVSFYITSTEYVFLYSFEVGFSSVVLVWFPLFLGCHFAKYAKSPAEGNKHLSFKWLIPLSCCCHVNVHTQQPLQWAGAA